jgi:hypothetical protein
MYMYIYIHVMYNNLTNTLRYLSDTQKIISAGEAVINLLNISCLDDFMKMSIKVDTSEKHKSKWNEWLNYNKHVLDSTNIFLESQHQSTQAHTLCKFILYLIQRGRNANYVQKVCAAMKFHYTLSFQSLELFDHPAVVKRRAREGVKQVSLINEKGGYLLHTIWYNGSKRNIPIKLLIIT